MPEINEKILQRKKLVEILTKYKDCKNDTDENISKDIKIIKSFKDENFSIKLILNELTSQKSRFNNICAFFLTQCFNKNFLEKEIKLFLEDKTKNDRTKFFLISILRQEGIKINFQEEKCFSTSPIDIAQIGINEFLNNALNDPEIQIDLLDFCQNVTHKERYFLLKNIEENYKDDKLANAFSLIGSLDLSCDELKIVINSLINSKSKYAIYGLENLLKKTEQLEEADIKQIRKNLSKLKSNFNNFKNDVLSKNNIILKSFMSYIDGFSNFSLVFAKEITEKENKGKINACFVTINSQEGIISTTGFGAITKQNYKGILKRLFSDVVPVEITPCYAKEIVNYFEEINYKKNTELPYEYIVWKQIFNDIEKPQKNTGFFKPKIKPTILEDFQILKLANSGPLETWYFTKGQYEIIDKTFKKIEQSKSLKKETLDKLINSLSKNLYKDEKFMNIIKDNLKILSKIAYVANLQICSSFSLSLSYDEKNLEKFIKILITKTIHYYLFDLLEAIKNKPKNNRFVKSFEINLSSSELLEAILYLEAKWKEKE